MAVSRLDAVADGGWNTSSFSYTVSSGTNRCLIVFVVQADPTLGTATVTYGGSSMTEVGTAVDSGSNRRMQAFYMNDSGITGAGSTTVAMSGATSASPYILIAASYEFCNQSTPTNYHSTTGTATNPLSDTLTSVVSGSATVACGMTGDSRTSTWGTDLTEQQDSTTTLGGSGSASVADSFSASGSVVAEITWSGGVFNTIIRTIEIFELSGPVITDVNTTESWTDGATGLVITGTGFVV